MRLDAPDGTIAGTVEVTNTQFKYKEFSCKLKGAKGVHDLYLVFKGNAWQKRNLFNFDWWQIK